MAQYLPNRFSQDFLVMLLSSNTTKNDEQIKEVFHFSEPILAFSDTDSCIDLLTKANDRKVILILPDSFPEHLLMNIHDLFQLDSIYIYGDNQNQNWIEKWKKVQGIFNDIPSISSKLQRKIRFYENSIASVTTISPSFTPNLNEIEPSFMYTQLLKEILIDMEYNETTIEDFVNFLRNIPEYQSASSLNRLEEFKRTYKHKTPIWWYTKEDFIYYILNHALRTQDVNVIIKMGFFIRDLYKEIKQIHSTNEHSGKISVYRGQAMRNFDFEKLKQSEGGLLSFNNFLSTSVDESVSRMFAESNAVCKDMVGILFEIEIDSTTSSIPFAFLDSYSAFDDEKEILFSMHTVFRIREIKKIGENLWTVLLTMTADNDEQLKNLTKYIQNSIGGDIPYSRLGWLMIQINELDQGEKIYKTILETIPKHDHIGYGVINNQLGIICHNKGDRIKAIEYYEKAVESYSKSSTMPQLYLAIIYNNMADTYRSNGNYTTALSYYEKARIYVTDPSTTDSSVSILYRIMGDYSKALSCIQSAIDFQNKTLPENHPSIGISYGSMAAIYHFMGKYSIALKNFEIAIEIFRKSLPPEHPRFAEMYNGIGMAYESMVDYTNALLYYEKAVEIQNKSLPLIHRDRAMVRKNIGNIYALMGKYNSALDCLREALDTQKKILSPTHNDIATTYSTIGWVYDSLRDYQNALNNYNEALAIKISALSNKHPDVAVLYKNIGSAHESLKDYPTALKHYQKALEIELVALTPNHPALGNTYNNMGTVYHSMKNSHKALYYFLKALHIQENNFPQGHPDIAKTYDNIGVVYNAMGEASKALLYYEKALRIHLAYLPPTHPEMVPRYINMGIAYFGLKDYPTALTYFKKVLEIEQAIFSPTHISIADTYDKIAMMYFSMEDYSASQENYKNALEIRHLSPSADQLQVATNHYNLAKTYERLNQYKQAIEHAQQAVDIAKSICGPEHPEVKDNQDYLDKLLQKL